MGRSPTARPLLAGAAVLALLAGCAPRQSDRLRRPEPVYRPGTAPREGAGPLWEWEKSAEGHLHYRILGPLIEGRSRPGGRMFVFRPLFSHEDEGPGSTRWTFRALWPLITIQRNDESRRVRIFPIIWYRNRVGGLTGQEKEEFDKDFWILPFMLTGSDSQEGKYFALWPAGGMVKGIFGKKYIRFVLWPLWVEGQDKNYHSWNVPWPIFGIWRGPDQRGWRLWPIYGVNAREGRFRRVFFLWPLGHHWQTGLDTDAPGEVWAFIPFWAKIENKHLRYVTVLWPFFSRKHDRKSNFVEWHCPWPIFSRAVGPGVRGLKIFPFYSHRFTGSRSDRTILWKLWHWNTASGRKKRTTRISSLFIFQHLRDEWIEIEEDGKIIRVAPPLALRNAALAAARTGRNPDAAGRKERPVPEGQIKSRVHTLLWPLFRYRREAGGEKFFTLLEPWWWRNSEIWDRHYGPFVTLYRYQRFADGTKEERALFNLYAHRRSPSQRRVRLFPVFDYRREGEEVADYKRFRILGGIFGYERRGQGKRVRFLWIPIGRRPKEWQEPAQ